MMVGGGVSSLLARAKRKLKKTVANLGVRKPESFGLNQLDVKLASYVNFRRGFFVEAGANDGVAQSNTLYLERYRSWKGLLIEPVPELMLKCRSNRPTAIVEQCALVNSDFPEGAIEMEFCNLMSVVRGSGGIFASDEAHIAAGRQYLKPGEVPYTVKVPARTLTSVLDAHGIRRVDLLSLDVEGYEGDALRGINFERHAPRYILVEANNVADVEDALGNRYELLVQLSKHDRLYRLRMDKRS
jgi:FkbM family methyltransferase